MITDILKGKIYNHATLPLIVIGVLIGIYQGGFSGFQESLFGVFVALLLFGWMFFFGFMGAGDVKMLMALGALAGVQFVVSVALLSIMLGGVMAVGVLFWRGSFRNFAQRIYVSLMSLVVKEIDVQIPELDKKVTMPFGVPIAIAAVWVVYENPLQVWGIFS